MDVTLINALPEVAVTFPKVKLDWHPDAEPVHDPLKVMVKVVEPEVRAQVPITTLLSQAPLELGALVDSPHP